MLGRRLLKRSSEPGMRGGLIPDEYSDGGYPARTSNGLACGNFCRHRGRQVAGCGLQVDRLSRSLSTLPNDGDVEKKGLLVSTPSSSTPTRRWAGSLEHPASFAQFEREIISERTRDKQVAARKRKVDRWTSVLGYDLDPRGGVWASAEEADRVGEVFRLAEARPCSI
jgi:site-specific DNA recombinase